MTRRLVATAGGLVALALTAGPAGASADGPTCAGYKGVTNHGEHVITDYVLGAVVDGSELDGWPPVGGLGEAVADNGGAALPGGPGPGFHFVMDAPPGASFCNPQAHSGGR